MTQTLGENSISVVVPVHDNADVLGECLSAIALSAAVAEVIVVDDASTDNSPAVAASAGARVAQLSVNSGPAAARNHGASLARGDILFFVDADVVLKPRMADRVKRLLADHPEFTAVFGSYDASPRQQNWLSQYRNLLHHSHHQRASVEASTFWAGCGAVRREPFLKLGGFDEKRFPYPSIEDIELGYRLKTAGHRILLDKALQGTHLKRWTLRSMLSTDILRRAVPWSELILESKHLPNDLNVSTVERVSAALAILVVVTLFCALVQGELLTLSLGALIAFIALNRELYRLFTRKRGPLFAVGCIPLHLLYYLYSSGSFLYTWLAIRYRAWFQRTGC